MYQIMVDGNIPAIAWANKIFGDKGSLANRCAMLRNVLAGRKTAGSKDRLVLAIPEKKAIMAVEDIHDEVFHKYDALRQHFVNKQMGRLPIDLFDTRIELQQESRIALTRAIFTYQRINVKFITYAHNVILRQIMDYMRKDKRHRRIATSADLGYVENRQDDTAYQDEQEKARKAFEQAKLSPFERDCMKAYMDNRTFTSVADSHGKTRAAASLAFASAKTKVRHSFMEV